MADTEETGQQLASGPLGRVGQEQGAASEQLPPGAEGGEMAAMTPVEEQLPRSSEAVVDG